MFPLTTSCFSFPTSHNMSEEIVLAKVTDILGRTGSRGGVIQVRAQFLGNTERSLVRNTIGPIRKDDILVLLESEREARRLK